MIDPQALYEEKALQFLKFRVSQELPRNLLVEVESAPSFLLDSLLVTLKTQILSERLPDRHYNAFKEFKSESPRSTWQMFKHTHRDSWWLRRLVSRHPVEFMVRTHAAALTVDLEDYLTYPYQVIANPKMGPAIRVPQFKTNWDWITP